jgi:N-acyl-D-amino-acid deacylase
MLDWILEGGDLIDGSRAARRRADVGIRRDRIAAVGDLSAALSARRLDVTGKVIVPGFIDAHSHSDLTVLANPGFESTIRQGVTTEVVGNCGLGIAPLSPQQRGAVLGQLQTHGYSGEIEWTSIADYQAIIAGEGISANLAWLVGHNAVRTAALDSPNGDPRQAMIHLLEEAMDHGAIGLSSGLEYEPGRGAAQGELIDLACVVASHGGVYASHIRNRDSALLSAVGEFLDVVRSSKVRGQLSHLNVRFDTGAPPDGWERAVGMIEDARRDGFDVMADTTPFTFGIGLMANVLPPWIFESGPAVAALRLGDPATRREVLKDVDRYWRFLYKGDWHRARLLTSPQHPEYIGHSFPDIGEARGKDPWNAFLDILEEAGPQLNNVWMIGDLFTEDHLVAMVRHPLFLLGADTMSARSDGAMGRAFPNPISFAAHVHFLLRYGLELAVLSLEELVWKMTGLPAERFGLVDRGTIRPGAFADIAVVDLPNLVERLSPPAYARGVDFVFTNGILVVDRGQHTGSRPGRHLSHQ